MSLFKNKWIAKASFTRKNNLLTDSQIADKQLFDTGESCDCPQKIFAPGSQQLVCGCGTCDICAEPSGGPIEEECTWSLGIRLVDDGNNTVQTETTNMPDNDGGTAVFALGSLQENAIYEVELFVVAQTGTGSGIGFQGAIVNELQGNVTVALAMPQIVPYGTDLDAVSLELNTSAMGNILVEVLTDCGIFTYNIQWSITSGL